MTCDELMTAVLARLRLPAVDVPQAKIVAAEILAPYRSRDSKMDDGTRWTEEMRERVHPQIREKVLVPEPALVVGPAYRTEPYNFPAQAVAWLEREIRRRMKL